MLRLGEKQKLQVIEKKEFGVYLAEGLKDTEKVLLPIKQVNPDCAIGDIIEVFLYRDSKDRLIATTNTPGLILGEVARLKVKETGKIGAFLDWGLEKDLLLPFKEQTCAVKANDEVLVALYIDKSSRLCATMKVYKYLQSAKAYKKDDQVTGIVYEISKNFGAFVAVDDKYQALIPQKELTKDIQVGQQITARVAAVKEDGKLDLSIREKAYIQMSIDADKIVRYLEDNDGVIPFTDKASPELIKEKMGMSKNEFKRAIGNLLKAQKITITENDIRSI